jgi:hypothetical protein
MAASFFPLPAESKDEMEATCFEWFASRQAVVVSMTWAWGAIPDFVTKSRRVALWVEPQ